MAESPAQIEGHIRSTRQELGSNLQELEHRVKDATNWRVQFERHPGLFLGAALGAGALLSAAFGGRRTHSYADVRSSHASPPTPVQSADHRSAVGEWHHIKSGLMAAAGTQVQKLLGELIPGFREHIRRMEVPSVSTSAPDGTGNTNGGDSRRAASAAANPERPDYHN